MRATVYGENEPCSRRAASSSDISVWKKLTKIHILSNLVLIILKLKQKKELACPTRFIIIIILQSLCLNFFPHLSQICRWLIVTFLWASVSISFFLPPLLFPPPHIFTGWFKKFTYLSDQSFWIAKLVCGRKFQAPGLRPSRLACEAFGTQAVGRTWANHPVVGRVNFQQYADTADQGLVCHHGVWGDHLKKKIFWTK